MSRKLLRPVPEYKALRDDTDSEPRFYNCKIWVYLGSKNKIFMLNKAGIKQLQNKLLEFDAKGILDGIDRLNHGTWSSSDLLLKYHDLLLFARAYPLNATVYQATLKALKKIEWHTRKHGDKTVFMNSGLPYSKIALRFSWEMTTLLNNNEHCEIRWHSFEREDLDLGALLKPYMPAVMHEICSSGYDAETFFHAMGVDVKGRLSFLLDCLATEKNIWLRDLIWQQLGLFTEIRLTHSSFALANNIVLSGSVYYHADKLKHFDHQALIEKKLPKPCHLSKEERDKTVACIRAAMTLNLRETDPSTFMDCNTLRVYPLERGVSVAIFGMLPERQLPYESYIGYTLFKNGLPIAYGGSWIWADQAKFGLNILEPYRGGESGYVMCQLLRVYQQVFGLKMIEVDAYQFGLDNPDGIRSGAYWFYYRYGFRSMTPELCALAEQEKLKMKRNPSYRSSEKTLVTFTGSNMIWRTGEGWPMKHPAEQVLEKKSLAMTQKPSPSFAFADHRLDGDSGIRMKMIQEFEELCEVMGYEPDPGNLKRLVQLKMKDPYRYNATLQQWLNSL